MIQQHCHYLVHVFIYQSSLQLMPVEVLTPNYHPPPPLPYRGMDEDLGDSSLRILETTGEDTETDAEGRRRGVPMRDEVSLAAGGD